MFNKPSYCCHCGQKIEKPNFIPIKDSGKYCDVCKNDFPFQEYFSKVLVLFCILFGIGGLGSYLFKGESEKPVALKESKAAAPQSVSKVDTAVNLPQNSNRQNTTQIPPKNESQASPNANQNASENRKTEVVKVVEEKTYYCGAATKKGTPCSRKVKGGGRCWQHKGQEALFPAEKLTVTQ